MKKAFTIIELIFVIIILGILSSFAIYKVVNARTDAYNLKQLEKFKTLVDDINAYYLLNGDYAIVNNLLKPLDLSKMSEVRGDVDWGESGFNYGFNASDNNICFSIMLSEKEEGGYRFIDNVTPNISSSKACKSLLGFFKHHGIDVNDVSGLFGMISVSSAFK